MVLDGEKHTFLHLKSHPSDVCELLTSSSPITSTGHPPTSHCRFSRHIPAPLSLVPGTTPTTRHYQLFIYYTTRLPACTTGRRPAPRGHGAGRLTSAPRQQPASRPTPDQGPALAFPCPSLSTGRARLPLLGGWPRPWAAAALPVPCLGSSSIWEAFFGPSGCSLLLLTC